MGKGVTWCQIIVVNPVLLLRSWLAWCRASLFLTACALELCVTSCQLAGLHLLLPREEILSGIGRYGHPHTRQHASVSVSCIRRIYLWTGDKRLKTLTCWWVAVNLLIQGLVSYLLLQKSLRKKGRAPRSCEVLCMCCLYRQVLHVTMDLLLAGPVLLYFLDILGKSSAALNAGGTLVVSSSWQSGAPRFQSGLFFINYKLY